MRMWLGSGQAPPELKVEGLPSVAGCREERSNGWLRWGLPFRDHQARFLLSTHTADKSRNWLDKENVGGLTFCAARYRNMREQQSRHTRLSRRPRAWDANHTLFAAKPGGPSMLHPRGNFTEFVVNRGSIPYVCTYIHARTVLARALTVICVLLHEDHLGNSIEWQVPGPSRLLQGPRPTKFASATPMLSEERKIPTRGGTGTLRVRSLATVVICAAALLHTR